MMKAKGTWVEFENLTAWINKCLHKAATITPNDKIPDLHTGQLRQVDISIRMSDGPTDFLGIVEVRKRARPVGINYVEEIHCKKQAIGAHAAFIVSSGGFYATAVQKANALGIKLFTLEEALHENWSSLVKSLNYITQRLIRSKDAVLAIVDKETHSLIEFHDSVEQQLQEEGMEQLLFVDEERKPFRSPKELYETGLKVLRNEVALPTDEMHARPCRIIVNITDEKKPFLLDNTGNYREIECFRLTGLFWIQETTHKVKVTQYKDPESNRVYAEVVATEEPTEINVELLIENPDDPTKGHQMYVRKRA